MLFSGIVKGRNMVVCELKDGKLRTVYDLLKDSSITQSYPNLFLTSSSLDMPYLVCEDAYNFCNVFEILDSPEVPSDNVLTQIKSTIDDILPLSIEEYKLLHKGLVEVNNYFDEKKVEINFPTENYENFKETKLLVNKVKRISGGFSVSNNKTLFRENENSELFIMIPSTDSLVLFEDVTYFIPSMKNVFVPFKDKELYGYNYRNFMKRNYLTEESILGDPNNNRFEPYPEEERYYNALKALHNSLMEREHPNNTLEECVQYNEYSDVFKNYITYMLVEVLRYHRNHSGFISLESYVDDEDDDEDDGSDKPGDELSVNLFYSNNKKGNFDGEELIKSLVEDQIKKDCYAPINLLIQAFRFGSKLPTKLELPNHRFFDLKEFSYSNMSGSFSSYTVRKTASGNNYVVVGMIYNNNSISNLDYAKSLGLTRPKLDSPVGLVLKKFFVDSDEYQLTLISFVDLVNFIGVDESLTIDGISRVNGDIRIDESLLPENLLNNSMTLDSVVEDLNYPSFISYVNPVMKGDYMECGCYNNSLSPLGLLRDAYNIVNANQLNIFVSVSKEDVFDKVNSYRLSPDYILKCTISYYYLDQMVKIDNALFTLSMDKFDYNLSDIISVYSEIVAELGYPFGAYSTELGSLSKNVQTKLPEVTAPSTGANSNSGIKDSSVFSDSSKVEEVGTNNSSVEEGGNMYNLDNLFYKGEFNELIKVVLPTEVVNKVNLTYKETNKPFEVKSLSSYDDLTVVGYLTQVNGSYVLLYPKVYNNPISKKKFTLTKLKSNILSNIRVIASGEIPKVKFDSLESLDYYCKILEKC